MLIFLNEIQNYFCKKWLFAENSDFISICLTNMGLQVSMITVPVLYKLIQSIPWSLVVLQKVVGVCM
jgi:hypothetical protein